MAGKAPSMITGANATIYINGEKVAYAINISYRTDIQTIPIEAMGSYEVLAYEPIATYVSGSMSVIRYSSRNEIGISTGISSPAVDVVQPGQHRTGTSVNSNALGTKLISGTDESNKLFNHINPNKLLASKTVDIKIDKRQDNVVAEQIIWIKDARLSSVTGTISRNNVLIESYDFIAEILQGDFTATASNTKTDLT